MMENYDWNVLNNSIIECRLCPRLVQWREKMSREKVRRFREWNYWGKPVPGFGDNNASILIIGLAPGAHGSNRTGRMFTGDASGDFLYSALHKAGFSNQPNSQKMNDGLKLTDVFITSVCRCVPPGNKPLAVEIENCQNYLLKELHMLGKLQGIVALGKIAFDWSMKNIFTEPEGQKKKYGFKHGALVLPESKGKNWLIASYHPSRQNTQTGRLTAEMFNQIWETARKLIEKQL